jgi:hypothetical protein
MKKSILSDRIPTEEELARIFPSMRVVGGRRPSIVITNGRLSHAVALAENRAIDTGRNIHILDGRNQLICQVDAA